MKKLIFACVLAVASLGVANAQSAIGARFGSGIEFSYLHGLNSGNRVSIDAGFPMFWGFEWIVKFLFKTSASDPVT